MEYIIFGLLLIAFAAVEVLAVMAPTDERPERDSLDDKYHDPFDDPE